MHVLGSLCCDLIGSLPHHKRTLAVHKTAIRSGSLARTVMGPVLDAQMVTVTQRMVVQISMNAFQTTHVFMAPASTYQVQQ